MSNWDSKTAEWYAEKYGEYPTNRLGIEALALPSDVTVVDVGCGTGAALRHAAAAVTDGTLIGVDPVPRMVEIAQEKTAAHAAAARIQFHVGPAEALPLDSKTADFVLAFDSFHHWQDPAQGLKEVGRILKENGRFVIVKDGGLPGQSEAAEALLAHLANATFTIVEEKKISENDVSFTMWVCRQTLQ